MKLEKKDVWESLDRGRLLLNIYEGPDKFIVLKINSDFEKGYECRILHPDEKGGRAWLAGIPSYYQIIQDGPFDGSKLPKGTWVWVEGYTAAFKNGWHQIINSWNGKWFTVETAHGLTGNFFKADGTRYYDGQDGRVFYCPPSLITAETKLDPYAEWKALKPGRIVIAKESKNIYRITQPWTSDRGGQLLGVRIHGVSVGVEFPITTFVNYWIVPEGEFDGSKLSVRDWVWCEGWDVDDYNGWHMVHEAWNGEYLWVDKTRYASNGTRIERDKKQTIHYYPPFLDKKETAAQREERIEKELSQDKLFIDFALRVVSGELEGKATCPLRHIGYCALESCKPYPNGQINKKTPCFKLYGQISKCPCYEVGPKTVKDDLLRIIRTSLGV